MSCRLVPPHRRPRRSGPGVPSRWPLVLCLSLVAFLPASPAGASTGDALVVLRTTDIDGLWTFVDRYEREGARFPHVYPPDILIGDVPERLESRLAGDPAVLRLLRKGDAPGAAKTTELRTIVIDSWLGEPATDELPAAPGGDSPYRGLVIPPPAAGKRPPPPLPDGTSVKTYGRAFGADFYQTSEWMLGKIAVGVILPEYAGGSYSISEMTSINEQIRGAMDFWAAQARVVVPGARFVYHLNNRVHVNFNFLADQPRVAEEEWIPEALGEMGFHWLPERDASYPAYEYVDSIRTAFETEWGFCIFLPKAPSFRAEFDAYSRFGGPYIVAPSGIKKDSGWLVAGHVWLTHVLIHEVGHLFWALDESCESGFCVPCHIRSGYLNIWNKNSMNRDYTCDPDHVPCCMEIPMARACEYTLAMMGIRDRDEDDIPDVLDTHPYVGPLRLGERILPDTITTTEPLLEGVAKCMPLVNYAAYSGVGAHESFKVQERRSDVTFNSIEHVIYRIDESVDKDGNELWFYGDPRGGWGGDSTLVHFSFVPDSLTGGDHVITLRAINTMGNRSNAMEHRIPVFVKAIALHDFEAVPGYAGKVLLSFRVRGGTFGATARLFRSSPETAETLLTEFPLEEDSPWSFVDESPRPGVTETYRLEISALGMTWNHEATIVSPAPLRKGNFLSDVTPNPFRGETVFSFRVPRGNWSERGGGNGKPGEGTPNVVPPATEGAPSFAAGSYMEARVEIDAYNLAGRRVRSFPRVHAYEGIYIDPVRWDGRDDSGRRLPAGVYFVRFRSGDFVESRKVILLD